MYPNGIILNIAAHDAELAERLLIENERQAAASQPAQKTARSQRSFWSKLQNWSGARPMLVTVTEPCAECGD